MKINPAVEYQNWAELLAARAQSFGNEHAFSFLGDGPNATESSLTFGELNSQARLIGTRLRNAEAAGRPVLLLYPPGLEFVAALFGCFYAGAIAVPTYPPDSTKLNRTTPRLRAIVSDSGASIALTSSPTRALAEMIFPHVPELGKLHWISTDTEDDGVKEETPVPAVLSDALALLQYTSGSTARPRGVILTNANLLENSAFIQKAFGHSRQSRGVIWLPPYHDMGLIGGILQPIYAGFPCTLMSPLAFLRRPVRWLRAITSFRGTTSGGPNFAYDACVRRIPAPEREGLDLSSWDVAFNGAEPVRWETIETFAQTFEPYGFRLEAFYPCYGLAEGTLQITGGRKALPPTARAFSKVKLAQNCVGLAQDEDSGRILVGCGQSSVDHEIAIVDPTSLENLPPNRVGEIWVSGSSVAQGYWNRAEDTETAFRAALVGTADHRWLRTGDIGFVYEGELFVTGRLKDLLIIRGRNYYPQEIEGATETSDSRLRTNCSAAFTVSRDGVDRLVVVAEVSRAQSVDYASVITAIRKGVATAVDLQVYEIALVAPRCVPLTPSGKVQRSFCRSLFLDGRLEVVAQWSIDNAFEESQREATD